MQLHGVNEYLMNLFEKQFQILEVQVSLPSHPF